MTGCECQGEVGRGQGGFMTAQTAEGLGAAHMGFHVAGIQRDQAVEAGECFFMAA